MITLKAVCPEGTLQASIQDLTLELIPYSISDRPLLTLTCKVKPYKVVIQGRLFQVLLYLLSAMDAMTRLSALQLLEDAFPLEIDELISNLQYAHEGTNGQVKGKLASQVWPDDLPMQRIFFKEDDVLSSWAAKPNWLSSTKATLQGDGLATHLLEELNKALHDYLPKE